MGPWCGGMCARVCWDLAGKGNKGLACGMPTQPHRREEATAIVSKPVARVPVCVECEVERGVCVCVCVPCCLAAE